MACQSSSTFHDENNKTGLDFLAQACCETIEKLMQSSDSSHHQRLQKITKTTAQAEEAVKSNHQQNITTVDTTIIINTRDSTMQKVVATPYVQNDNVMKITWEESSAQQQNTDVPPNKNHPHQNGPKLLGNEPCLICGRRATGYHYTVTSCEGCKVFFRRSVVKKAYYHYRCKNRNGNCSMNLQVGRKCQLCRFKKCVAAGMTTDSVILARAKVKMRKIVQNDNIKVIEKNPCLASSNKSATITYEIKSCSVCGLGTTETFLNITCCENCKTFFKKGLRNNAYLNFECQGIDQNCAIDSEYTCQYCRFIKCVSVGMKTKKVILLSKNDQLPNLKKKTLEKPIPPNIAELSNSEAKRRKKGPLPLLIGDELCLICGLKASAYHYNVLSCEGCKGFFRRSIKNNTYLSYVCNGKDGTCAVNIQLKRKCQLCRYNKCLDVGMKREYVLSGDEVMLQKLKRDVIEKTFTYPGENIESLTPQQLNMLEVLRQNVRRFKWPVADDVQKLTKWVDSENSNHAHADRMKHFTELAVLIVQLVVEFTKQLPGFTSIEQCDQMVLIKANIVELVLLKAAKQYATQRENIQFLCDRLYDKTCFYKVGIQMAIVEPIFAFCKSMARLNLDDAEYAMLVAINTFSSDRASFLNMYQVDKIQDLYMNLLRVYCKNLQPNNPLRFPRILMKLVELREISTVEDEDLFIQKLKIQNLTQTLSEIFDTEQ